jgi:hypothetical protein
MSANKIEIGFVTRSLGGVIGVLDFGTKEACAFADGQVESMHEKVRFNLLARGQGSVWIPGDHMDFMPSSAELVAEVIGDPAGSTDGVREENVCQHQGFHQ